MNAQQSPSIRIASTAANDAQSDGARLFGGQLTLVLPMPTARRSDPGTSHAAAAEAKELAARHHRLILDALRTHGPLGKSGVAAKSGLTEYQVGKRLTELGRAELIALTGNEVRSAAGRAEREWRAA